MYIHNIYIHDRKQYMICIFNFKVKQTTMITLIYFSLKYGRNSIQSEYPITLERITRRDTYKYPIKVYTYCFKLLDSSFWVFLFLLRLTKTYIGLNWIELKATLRTNLAVKLLTSVVNDPQEKPILLQLELGHDLHCA